MFDKFGEFDSAEELNRAAAAQLQEGDTEAILAIAKENGLDAEDAEDYIDGCMEELTTPLLAAAGKLRVEKEEYRLGGILSDWADELTVLCTEQADMAAAVRKKGKSLAGYIALLAEEGYRNRTVVDNRIVQLAPSVKNIVGNHEFAIGVPDKSTRKRLAEQYYLGGAE